MDNNFQRLPENVDCVLYTIALVKNAQALKYTSMPTRVQVGDYAEISGQRGLGGGAFLTLPRMIGRVSSMEYVEGWVPHSTQFNLAVLANGIATYHWRATVTFHGEDIDINGPLRNNQPRPPLTLYWVDFVNIMNGEYNYVISKSSEIAYNTYMSAGYNVPAFKDNIKF
jgi:hypothetical protein